MSMVQVKYRGHLALLTGLKEENLNAANVGDLLKTIGKQFSPEAEKAARSMLITVNGESIHLLRLFKTSLLTGDIVGFYPICAGG